MSVWEKQFHNTAQKQEREYALIFITAMGEHVYDAFALEAVDYLCKPIEEDRLLRALERAVKRIRKRSQGCLLIQTMSWSKTIKLSRILYCEVINRKSYLHTTTGVVDYYCKIQDLEKQETIPVSRLRRQCFMEAMLHHLKKDMM